MKKGDLVRHKQHPHELGIVWTVTGDQARVLLGDGLSFVAATDNWEVLPFYEGASIPANFVELVEAYATYKVVAKRRGLTRGGR